MKTYKGWQLLETMPEGWQIDSTAGSPLHKYKFITNGKSVISGQQQRVLLLVSPDQRNTLKKPSIKHQQNKQDKEQAIKRAIDPNFSRAANDLARAKFKEKLLSDILFDLMVCEIEGWSKRQYISELKALINGIKV